MKIEEFARRVMELTPQLMKVYSRNAEDVLASGSITFPQFRVLYSLAENGRLKMKDLASHFVITPAAATGLIDRLMHQGLVVRENDASDRRIVWIGLSPKGKTTICNIKKQRARTITEVFGKLSEQDRETYIRILEKITS